jgi:hypothetical protein
MTSRPLLKLRHLLLQRRLYCPPCPALQLLLLLQG